MADDAPDNPGSEDERPCLHCLIADLIDEFYAEYGSPEGEKDTVDMDVFYPPRQDWLSKSDAYLRNSEPARR